MWIASFVFTFCMISFPYFHDLFFQTSSQILYLTSSVSLLSATWFTAGFGYHQNASDSAIITFVLGFLPPELRTTHSAAPLKISVCLFHRYFRHNMPKTFLTLISVQHLCLCFLVFANATWFIWNAYKVTLGGNSPSLPWIEDMIFFELFLLDQVSVPPLHY